MQKLLAYLKDSRGVAAIEFAFVLPILLLLAFPTIDYARFILMQQKAVKSAFVIADAVALSAPIIGTTTCADIRANPLFLRVGQLQTLTRSGETLIRPFGPNYALTIMNGNFRNNQPIKMWEHRKRMGPRGSGVFVPGPGGEALTVPQAFAQGSSDGDDFLKVYFGLQFRPITPNLESIGIFFLRPQTISFEAIYPSRNGALANVAPDNVPLGPCNNL